MVCSSGEEILGRSEETGTSDDRDVTAEPISVGHSRARIGIRRRSYRFPAKR